MKRFVIFLISLFSVVILCAQTHDTDVWTVFGDAEIVNGNKGWDVTVTANDMSLKGGVWTLTVKNAKLYETTYGSCHPDPYYFAISLNHSKTATLPEGVYDSYDQTFYHYYGSSISVSKTGYYNITYNFNGNQSEWWYSDHYELEYVRALDPEYTVMVSSDNLSMGTVTGGGNFVCGEKTTIKATPLPGNRFVGWSDGNKTASRSITVTESADFIAYFEPGGYVVIGDGELLNSTNEWQIEAKNTMLLLEDGSYSFTVRTTLEKTDTYCHQTYRCAVALSSDGKVVFPKAVYASGEYLRTKGVVVSVSHSGVYDVLFTFKEGASKPTVKLTLVETRPNPTYTINVTPNIAEGGTTTGGGVYECAESFTITATPASGYCFSKWSDGKTANTRTLTATKDEDYIAEFKTCGFSVGGEGGGNMVSLGSGKWQYVVNGLLLSPTCGTLPTFTVINDESGKKQTITISKSSVKEAGLYDIAIVFNEGDSKVSYELTLIEAIPDVKYTVVALPNETEGGTVTGSGEYVCGKTVTIKATPNPGWKFSKWDNGATSATQKFAVNQDTTLVAFFVPIVYTVVGDIDVVNGDKAYDKENTDNDMEVDAKKVWTLTVHNKLLYKTGTYCHSEYRYAVVLDHKGSYKPDSYLYTQSVSKTGYYDITYTYDQSYASLSCTLSLIEEVDNSFTIKALSDNLSQGVTTSLTRTYQCGENVKIKATPLPGFRFVTWSNGVKTATQTIIVTQDSILTAYFEPVSWTLIGDADIVNGTAWDASNSANDLTLKDGIWTITIADRQLEKTGTGCHAVYKFAVANNHSLDVTRPTGIKNGDSYKRSNGVTLNIEHSGRYNIIFTYTDGDSKPKYRLDTIQLLPNPTYTVTVNSSNPDLGSVKGGGTFDCGSTVSVTAVPKTGSTFLNWSNGYTSTEIEVGPLTANTTLTAYFEDDVYTVVGDHYILNGETDWDLYESANTMEQMYDAFEYESLYVLRVKKRYLNVCHNGGVYEYRIVHNHAYSDSYGNNTAYPESSRAKIKITKNGLYDIVFKFDPTWFGGGWAPPRRANDNPPHAPAYIDDGLQAIAFIIEEYGSAFAIEVASANSKYGSVSGGGQYGCGETVTIVATPNKGYVFKRWSDDSTEPTRTFTAEGDMQFIAYFDCIGGCNEIEELYLGHEATSLTVEEQLMNPTYLAYPTAVENQLSDMICADGATYEDDYIAGALKGLFSVAKDKQVRFSYGNLQYIKASDTYRFAPQQYNIVSPPCQDYFYYDACNDINPADLPLTDHFQYPKNNFWEEDIPPIWRMMSKKEWDYLLNKRTNYKQLRTNVIVNDVPGCLLLPDDYTHTFPFKLNRNANNYTSNQLSLSQFELLEKAGAVFLPAAGYYYPYGEEGDYDDEEAPMRKNNPRKIAPTYGSYGYSLYEYTYSGYYWTTTKYEYYSNYYCVYFSYYSTVNCDNSLSYNYLHSIRLVTDVK